MVVDISLKRAGDSVTGQSNVDPKGYLTDLGHIKISTDAEIGDIKRARTLLKSVVSTNPNNAPGWVAAARLVGSSCSCPYISEYARHAKVDLCKAKDLISTKPSDNKILRCLASFNPCEHTRSEQPRSASFWQFAQQKRVAIAFFLMLEN